MSKKDSGKKPKGTPLEKDVKKKYKCCKCGMKSIHKENLKLVLGKGRMCKDCKKEETNAK